MLFLVVFVNLSAIYSQEKIARTQITLQFENATIKSILNSIEKQTDYIFIYNADVINSNLKKSIRVKGGNLEEVLITLFKGLDVESKIDGRQVYLLKKTKAVEPKSTTEKKSNVITGLVTDEENQIVIGANIVVSGSTTGTITDLNGFFSIEASENAQLIVSYIGYETKLVDIKGKSNLKISIHPAIKTLDELVVVGYGLQKKSDVTGSIVQVKAAEIENTPTSDIAASLQGKVSGVYIMNNSGQAGAGVDIQIRGVTSLSGASTLWIIDGVPGDATTVNMNDVENIDIIKDGAAAAIYGVKAAAGVILVTTKRGIGQKKPKISFNTYTGSSSAWRLPEMLNSDQYITLKNEQWSSTGVPRGLSLDSIGKYSTTNWMKEMFREGKVQNYDLNISGSTETTNYYFGGTYFRNDPSFVDNSLERFSFRINSDYKITRWLKIGESLSFLTSKANPVGAEGVYLASIFRAPPMMPVYDSANQPGGYGYVNYKDLGDYDGENPMSMQLTDQSVSNQHKISGNAYATLYILPGLTVTGTLAGDFSFDDSKSVSLPYKLAEEKKNHATTDIRIGFSKGWNMLFNVYANYNKEFGQHTVNLTAGYEASQYAGSNLNGNGVNAKYGLLVLSQTDIEGRTTGGTEWHGRSISQFGRFSYQYGSKYTLRAIVRRDGSDKFGPLNRYGVFPSVSLAWKLSEEEIIKNIPFISFLKLRGGYGINGSDNIGQYQYESYMATPKLYPYGTSSTVVNYSSIAASGRMANPSIQWERSKHLDSGLELGLFKNALFINIEPYKKSSDKMLFYKQLPLSSGLAEYNQYTPTQVINAGKITNRGVDISVTYKGNIGEFRYSLGGNVSTINYTVDELADNSNVLLASPVLAAGVQVSKTTVGQSSGYFFGYQCDGIFQTQEEVDQYNQNARDIAKENNPGLTPGQLSAIFYNSPNTAPGDLIFRDLNGDGKISPDDREKIGSPWPEATYGFQVTADYKGIDLRIASAGVYGRDVFNESKVDMYQFSNYDYSTTTMALTRWTPENRSTTNYRINGNDPNKNMSNPSSWYIEDGSFFRIKNVELGYTIPKKWSDKVGMSRFRIYISGQNLLTFTKYTGFDPEFGIGSALSAGVDGGSYPQSKIYMMGLQIEF
jgi:TonB-linked SusC/RagA family outer membrane protein